mgnify:CR=1 FL=1
MGHQMSDGDVALAVVVVAAAQEVRVADIIVCDGKTKNIESGGESKLENL